MAEHKHKHPAGNDLYTPMTPEMLALFERMRAEHGSWRRVAALSGTRLKVLRNLRAAKRKAISQRLLDRLVTGTGVGALHEFIWFTADDLVALGIWEPVMYVEGERRVQGGNVHFGTNKKASKKRKVGKKKRRT